MITPTVKRPVVYSAVDSLRSFAPVPLGQYVAWSPSKGSPR